MKCLLGTRNAGTQENINAEIGLMVHVDSYFANARSKINPDDVSSLFSNRTCDVLHGNVDRGMQ